MKFIKVSGNDTQFENIFNSEILVKKNSKIGLISAAIKLSDEIIEIDNSNKLIKVKTRDSLPSVDITLKTGKYNFSGFVKEVNRAFNAGLGLVSGTLNLQDPNFQWKIVKNLNASNSTFRR